MSFKTWEVWHVDQDASRRNSDPQQPKDPSGKTRMYVIVCPQAHLDSDGWPVCVPIGSKCRSHLLDAEIKAGEGGVHHTSYAWCNELFTIDPRFFIRKIGSLPNHCITDIKDGIRDFLELH